MCISGVCYDSFECILGLIDICISVVCIDLFVCVVCVSSGGTHSSVFCDSFVCLYQVCVVTHLYVYLMA